MQCPKCGFEQIDENQECIKCGIVFEKYAKEQMPFVELCETPEHFQEPVKTQEEFIKNVQGITKKGWKSIIIGSILAIIVFLIPFLSFIFRYFITLVHEFGHALTGWLFGYPSIPAFDFVYGGGITMHQCRTMEIVYFVYFLFFVLFCIYRKNKLSLLVISCLVILYSIFAFTNLHKILNLFMGHGSELIFAGIFTYRAISGTAIINPLERPLYAFLGFFTILCDTQFAFRLITSTHHRAQYQSAKGGGHWMDFSRIAENYLHIDLTTVAAFFLVLCLATIPLCYLYYRYEAYIVNFILKVIRKER